MSFAGDIRKFRSKTKERTEKVFRGTALSLLGKVILRTPVDTGRLRGNWQVNIGKAPTGTTEDTDQNGGPTINKGGFVIDGLQIGKSLFIVNNLEYAEDIENGGSNQAPAGMLKVTVAEYQDIVRQQTRKNK